MRFTSNGYPKNYIAVLEYDSSSIGDILPDVHAALDDLIAELQAETGAAQVDLLGHSLGTFVSHSYLATPARAANVAHYVNIDGQSSAAPPGGVPTLALWAGASPPIGEIVGATNVTVPDQEHVEVATSEESFFEMYQFFRGHAPITTRIQPQLRPRISGRVVAFPENVGLDGATLDLWWVHRNTGERIGSSPRATFEIGPDGSFGPYKGWYGANYEFAVTQEDGGSISYYYEPFIRSDHLVRLNVALLLEPFLDASDNHTSVTVIRYKELCGDLGAGSDVLEINGTNVLNPTTAACATVGGSAIAFFSFDDGSDGIDNLTTIPFPLSAVPFISGVDLFIPSDPPGTVSVETVPRGDLDAARTVNVPNIPSTEARLVIQMRDFEQ
jgi:hypothetical protein